MMVWEYFTHYHKSALCYTGVHVYPATSLHVFGNISGGFRCISRFFGNFTKKPEFRGSATARNIRSPDFMNQTL